MNSSWITWAAPGRLVAREHRRPAPRRDPARRRAGSEAEPGAADRRLRRARRRDDDLVARAHARVSERDERPDVTSAAGGGEENPHLFRQTCRGGALFP